MNKIIALSMREKVISHLRKGFGESGIAFNDDFLKEIDRIIEFYKDRRNGDFK